MHDILLNMPPDHFWIWAISFGVLAAVGFGVTFIFFYRARIIEDTPTSKIRSAAQGYVELEGMAKSFNGKPINAKLSQTPCLWYKYKIEKYVGGKNDKWRTVEEGQSRDFFLIKDNTGHCLIDPTGARVTTIYKGKWVGNSKFPVPGSSPKKNSPLLKLTFISGTTYRYTEERLHENDLLYALGNFKTFTSPNQIPTLNEEVRQYLNKLKQDPAKLQRHFDKNGDGKIDIQEWDEARQVVIQHVKAKYQSEVDAGIHLMQKPNERRHPYLLSAFPQDDLVQKYKRYSTLGLVGFFLSGAICTYMIAVRLSV